MLSTIVKDWERAALLFASGFLALRFIFLGDAPFVVDEPLFQMLLDQHLREGKIPITSFLGSSLPVPYGATALWIYTIPKLLSSHFMAIVYFHAFVFTLGAGFFYFGTRLWLGSGAAALALLLAAVSPFQFHYGRHPWDNTFLVPLSAALYWILAALFARAVDFRSALKYFIASGVVVALCVNLHLMSGPILLAFGLCLVIFLAKSRFRATERALLLGSCGLIALAISAPYLLKVLESIAAATPPPNEAGKNPPWGDFRNFWWILLRTQIFLSVWGVKNFIEPTEQYYYEYVGPLYAAIFRKDIFGWFPKIAAVAWLSIPFAQLARRRFTSHPLHLYAALCFGFTLLVYQYLNIPTQPHYFQAVWWISALGAAAVLLSLPPGKFRTALASTYVVSIAVNGIFILTSFAYIHANAGTRGMHHGTAIAEEKRVVDALCARTRATGKNTAIVNLSYVYQPPEPLRYFAGRAEACSGLDIQFVKDANAQISFDLVYPEDSKTDARLVIRER